MKANWPVRRTLAVALLMFGIAPAVASAEQMSWSVASYVTKSESKPVGDVEGHVTGTFTRRGLAFLRGGPADGEVAVYVNVGTNEVTKDKRKSVGESVYTFEDGSSFTVKNVSFSEPLPGGKAAYKVTHEFVKGTGRFEGIKGSGSGTGKLLTPNSGETKGDAYFLITTEFTLRKRGT